MKIFIIIVNIIGYMNKQHIRSVQVDIVKFVDVINNSAGVGGVSPRKKNKIEILFVKK